MDICILKEKKAFADLRLQLFSLCVIPCHVWGRRAHKKLYLQGNMEDYEPKCVQTKVLEALYSKNIDTCVRK